MLASDGSASVLREISNGEMNQIAYTAYGHRSAEQPVNTHLGYNGQVSEVQTGCYLLGNGYRALNPVLMKFHSPDSLSPFGEGGVNGYTYCDGNPVKYSDPTGYSPLSWLRSFFGSKPKPATTQRNLIIKPVKAKNKAKASNGNKAGGFWDTHSKGEQLGDGRRVQSRQSPGRSPVKTAGGGRNLLEEPPSGLERLTGEIKLPRNKVAEPSSGLERLQRRLKKPLLQDGVVSSLTSVAPNEPSMFEGMVTKVQSAPSRVQQDADSVRRAVAKR